MKHLTILFYLIFVFSFSGLTSCSSDSNDNKKLEDAKPITLTLVKKIETDNTFALDLFKTTYKSTDDENVFISPLSTNLALSMTLNGAKNATLDEMKGALRASDYSLDDINEYNKSLREALITVDPSTVLSIANSIWYHKDIAVNSDFISLNQNYYNAEVKAIDFNSSNAASQINNWVSGQTNNKISQIVNSLSAESKMCLINAIYFNGKWKSKFDKNNTREDDFYSETGVKMSTVQMMKQDGTYYGYSDDDYCAYLKIPYGNWAFSMIVMLPHDGKTVDDVISNLNNETWNNAMLMDPYEVNLSLPRFKAECAYEMQEAILPEMALSTPFTDNADFSGITEDQSLKISKVIHKTYIDVNEEGTEATAATNVEGGESSPPPGTIIDYVVNKPFAFAIRENSTGIILFMGKISNIN